MKKIVYILLLASFKLSVAQDFDSEMKLVYSDFIQSDKVAFNIDYVLHENHNSDSRVISTSKGKYVKIKDKYVSVYDSKLTLVSPSEIIMVDKDDKRIRVKKLKSKTPSGPDFVSQLKEYNKYISKLTVLSTNKENVTTYKIELKSNSPFPISGYELSIDTKKHYMVQMSIFYKRPLEKDEDYKVTGKEIPRLDIMYSDINSNKLFVTGELEEAHYYTKKNNKLTPSPSFVNYDVKEIL